MSDRIVLTAAERRELRRMRLTHGPGVKRLGTLLGVSKSLVGAWETGARKPTKSQLAGWWQHLSGEIADEPIAGDAGVVGRLLVEDSSSVA